jgi:hypothetical protein
MKLLALAYASGRKGGLISGKARNQTTFSPFCEQNEQKSLIASIAEVHFNAILL